jgi:glucosamine-6-phosphate deaminase
LIDGGSPTTSQATTNGSIVTLPRLQILPDAEAIADRAAGLIVETLARKPNAVLCLPTGRTPLAAYRRLVAEHRAGRASFARATLFIVDEYVGLGLGDNGAFGTYMRDQLVRHTDLPATSYRCPDGRADNPEAEARRYEAAIAAAGGLDFLMLGVGANGHIGFNEPGTPPGIGTHVIELAAETLAANRADLPRDFTPTHAITIGLGTILAARNVLVIASGRTKRKPLSALFGDASPLDWPVAVLREHAHTTVLCDPDAAPADAEQP